MHFSFSLGSEPDPAHYRKLVQVKYPFCCLLSPFLYPCLPMAVCFLGLRRFFVPPLKAVRPLFSVFYLIATIPKLVTEYTMWMCDFSGRQTLFHPIRKISFDFRSSTCFSVSVTYFLRVASLCSLTTPPILAELQLTGPHVVMECSGFSLWDGIWDLKIYEISPRASLVL